MSSPFMRLFASRVSAGPRSYICRQCRLSLRYSSTETTPSPTLSRIRNDLKLAMRAKDAPRLSVLRTILADITNASKTNSPITDDLSLLTLLKKKMAQTQTAIEEFYQANRKDLVKKEQEQLDVLREYAGTVSVMSRDEVQEVVKATIDEIKSSGRKAALGEVMKAVTGPGGKLEGRMVEKSTVVSVIREQIDAK